MADWVEFELLAQGLSLTALLSKERRKIDLSLMSLLQLVLSVSFPVNQSV